MLNTKTIDLIIKTYNENNSIYQAAKTGKVTYQTAKRILINNNIININKPEVIEAEIIEDLPIQAQNNPPGSILSHDNEPGNGITLPNNIYNINNNILNKDNINIPNEINNDINIKDDDLHSQLDNKKEYYNSKIDTVLNLILKEYKNNINLIPKSKLGIDFGIFYDKRFPKSADNTRINDNRSIIFANFGDNTDMISAITQIKSNKNKLVNR